MRKALSSSFLRILSNYMHSKVLPVNVHIHEWRAKEKGSVNESLKPLPFFSFVKLSCVSYRIPFIPLISSPPSLRSIICCTRRIINSVKNCSNVKGQVNSLLLGTECFVCFVKATYFLFFLFSF